MTCLCWKIPCPANGNTKRQEIKELIYELNGRYPGLKARAFGAMQRLPLPEWGPVEHRRRPLPEELGRISVNLTEENSRPVWKPGGWGDIIGAVLGKSPADLPAPGEMPGGWIQ